MPSRVLPLGLLLLGSGVAGAAERQREATEWSITYWYNANQSALPRVLLVGDSICNGYQALVRDKLAGRAYVAFYATSKCVTDRSYAKELAHVLGEYRYHVIHFNNGLHSLGTDRPTWEASLRETFQLLVDRGQGARILWANSTPLRDPAMTAKAQELNAIGARVAAELGIATNDLFALMDPLDRQQYWTDTFHYGSAGRELQANQVVEAVLPLLGDWSPPDGAAAVIKNPDFAALDGWRRYPDRDEAGSFALDPGQPHSGPTSARVTARQPGLQFYQAAPELTAGATYRLSYWARADAARRLQVHVRTQKPEYRYYGDQTVDLTTTWQRYETTLTVPDDYRPGEHVLFFCLLSAGDYWLDDVCFERL